MKVNWQSGVALWLMAAGPSWAQAPLSPLITSPDSFDCIEADPDSVDWHLASNSFLLLRTNDTGQPRYFINSLPESCELQPQMDERDGEPFSRPGFFDGSGNTIASTDLCRGDLLYTPNLIQQLYEPEGPPEIDRATHCALGPFWPMSDAEGESVWRGYIDRKLRFDFVPEQPGNNLASVSEGPRWQRVDLPMERPFSGAYEPDISGDGRYLVFVNSELNGDDLPTTYLYDRRLGTLEAPFADLVEEAVEPDISADGRFIAVSGISRAGSIDIFRYEIATKTLDTLRRLNSARIDLSPRLSGDGRLILHVRARRNFYRRNGSSDDVLLFDIEANRFIKLKFDRNSVYEQMPVISDDGRYIATSTCGNCLSWTDGQHLLYDRLLEQAFWHYRPTVDLNVDASIILYISGTDDRPTLLYADLSRGITVPLPDDAPPPVVSSGRISADGRFLIYATDAQRCFEESVAVAADQAATAECYSGLALYRLFN